MDACRHLPVVVTPVVCQLQGVLSQALAAWTQVLDQVTLAPLVGRPAGQSAPPEAPVRLHRPKR